MGSYHVHLGDRSLEAEKLLNMSRSSWKPPYYHSQRIRASLILPSHVGKSYKLYNGKQQITLKIQESMVGTKFGSHHKTRQHGTKN